MIENLASETALGGVALSPGVGGGRVCFIRQESAPPAVLSPEPRDEVARLYSALQDMSERLQALAQQAEEKLGKGVGEIFLAYQFILQDVGVRRGLVQAIEQEGLDAAGAVARQFARYHAELRALDSDYFSERAEDLAALEGELTRCLHGSTLSRYCRETACHACGKCRLNNDHILFASELTPSVAVQLDQHTRGIVVACGGVNSHLAILARGLGLPMVRIENFGQFVGLGNEILVDGNSGKVFINPSQATRSRYQEALRLQAQMGAVCDPVPKLKVMANLDRAQDVWQAVAAKAEGIGLYRSEMEVLYADRFLTESEQEAKFRHVAAAMGNRPVCIRLLDLGGEKAPAWLKHSEEANPALGCRGARLLLARPDLLRAQARALVRASAQRPIQVIYPMITMLEEFQALRAVFETAVADLPPARLSHGVMFEVPSACLQASEFFELIDFGCIGTNDLVQYLFATDRTGDQIDSHQLYAHPALWRLIHNLAEAAQAAGKSLSLCGDLASDPRYTEQLIAAGVKAVSASPRNIASVRRAVGGSCS